jgi:hypothetical protein
VPGFTPKRLSLKVVAYVATLDFGHPLRGVSGQVEPVSKTGSSGTPLTGGFSQVAAYVATLDFGHPLRGVSGQVEPVSKTGSSGTPLRVASLRNRCGLRRDLQAYAEIGFTPPDLRHLLEQSAPARLSVYTDSSRLDSLSLH